MGKAQNRRRREQRKRARETSFTDKKEGETHLNFASNISTPGKPPFKMVPNFSMSYILSQDPEKIEEDDLNQTLTKRSDENSSSDDESSGGGREHVKHHLLTRKKVKHI